MQINSVLGLIDTAELGVTLTHEHLAAVSRDLCFAYAEWMDMEETVHAFAAEMERLRPYGLATFVDGTPINLGRDCRLLAEASRRTGVHILACTGLYWMEGPWFCDVDADLLAEYFVRDIEQGMQGTDIKAAFVKCATDRPLGMSDTNRQFVKAAGRAAKKTGVPVYGHSDSATRQGLYQQEILLAEGLPPHKIMLGHAFDSGDLEYLELAARNGSYLGCDRLGFPGLCPAEKMADLIAALFDKGYGRQVTLSNDTATLSDFFVAAHPARRDRQKNLLTRGYGAVFERVLPALRARGLGQPEIDQLLVDNPRRFFEGTPL